MLKFIILSALFSLLIVYLAFTVIPDPEEKDKRALDIYDYTNKEMVITILLAIIPYLNLTVITVLTIAYLAAYFKNKKEKNGKPWWNEPVMKKPKDNETS